MPGLLLLPPALTAGITAVDADAAPTLAKVHLRGADPRDHFEVLARHGAVQPPIWHQCVLARGCASCLLSELKVQLASSTHQRELYTYHWHTTIWEESDSVVSRLTLFGVSFCALSLDATD